MSKEQKTILSESPENAAIISKVNDYINFIASEDRDSRGFNGTVNRFGILSSLIKRVPIYIYDHPEMCEAYETAFTDGRGVYFNANFFKALRADEIESGGHNIVPVILHELLHYAFKHTERNSLKELLKTGFDHYIMNIAMDSIINGIEYNSFSQYGATSRDTSNKRHLMKMGRGFLCTAVGMSEKEQNSALGDPKVASKAWADIMQKFTGKEDADQTSDFLSKFSEEERQKVKDALDKMEAAMKEVFQFLHWENTDSMTELEAYLKIKEMLENNQDFQDAQKTLDEASGQGQGGPGGQSPGGQGSPSLEEALKEVMKEMGEDYESGSHVISAEQLKAVLEKAGISEEEIKALGLPDGEAQQKESDAKATNIVDSAAHDAQTKDRSASLGQGKGNLPGFFKERITQKNQGLLDYKGELKSMLDFVVGQTAKLTIDVSSPTIEYFLDHEDVGLSMPVWEEDRMPSKSTGVVMVLIDTSGSVSDDLLAQFTSDIIKMSQYLNERGGKVVVCSADTDLKFEDIVEITEDNIADIIANGLPIAGRGGTDFKQSLISAGQLIDTVYKSSNMNEKKEEVAALIYLTDGEDRPPSRLPHPSLPSVIHYVVPKSQVSRLDAAVSGYAKVLPLEAGVTLDLGIETVVEDAQRQNQQMSR